MKRSPNRLPSFREKTRPINRPANRDVSLIIAVNTSPPIWKKELSLSFILPSRTLINSSSLFYISSDGARALGQAYSKLTERK